MNMDPIVWVGRGVKPTALSLVLVVLGSIAIIP